MGVERLVVGEQAGFVVVHEIDVAEAVVTCHACVELESGGHGVGGALMPYLRVSFCKLEAGRCLVVIKFSLRGCK